MLAGDRAAQADAQAQDVGGQRLGPLERTGLASVVEDERMQVAVAGMEHVGHAHAVLGRELLDGDECVAELRARHHAVLHDEVGADASHGRERALAALPEQRALVRILRHADVRRRRRVEHGPQARQLRIRLGLLAFELHEQHSRGIARVAGVHGGLGRFDRQAVHDLHRARQQACGDDAGDGVARGLQRRVRREHRAIGLGPRDEAHRDLDRDAEQPLGAYEQARQVGPHVFHAVAAEAHHLAVGQHHLESQHVIGRHAVAEAVRAARVEGHVAADGAYRLTRWIGRVVEAVRLTGDRDVEIDDPRLHHGDAVHRVDPQDAVHPVEGDDDAVFDGHRSARQARARPARHERHAAGVAQPHRVHDVLRRLGQHHRERPGAKGREAVALVRRERGRARQQPVGRIEPCQGGEHVSHGTRPL